MNGDPAPVQLYAKVTRKDDIPGVIDITGSIKGNYPINLKLGPGESGVVSYGYTAKPGTYTVEAEAWPAGLDDIYPSDNKDRMTFTVVNEDLDLDKNIYGRIIDGGPEYSR